MSIPDFTAVLVAGLAFLGVHPAIIALVALVLALESYVSMGQRALKLTTAVKGVGARGSSWLLKQRYSRIAITAGTALAVMAVQAFMIKLAYTCGSLISTAFDPVRREQLKSVNVLIDPEGLDRYLRMDLISLSFTTCMVLVMLRSYGSKGDGWPFWVLSTPGNIGLIGTLPYAVIAVLADVLLGGIPFLFTGEMEWHVTKEGYMGPGYFVIGLASLIYCATAFVAVRGGEIVGRLFRER